MRVFIPPRFLLLGVLGLFSGLPLALTASTLTAWLADSQVDRASIGLFAAIATPYALKFLWAPLLDGLSLPYLTARMGRRRGWLLLTQCLLTLAIAAMAFSQPQLTPWLTALWGVVIATGSATQDTLIDAYRVELLPPDEQGSGAAWATFGYRIGMLLSGAGALYLADRVGWQATYLLMAGVMGLGLVVTLLMRETQWMDESAPNSTSPLAGEVTRLHEHSESSRSGEGDIRATADLHAPSPNPLPQGERASRPSTVNGWMRAFILAPLRDFMTRPNWLAVLAFVILYKLGDAFMGTMFNPFLLDLGFTKSQIAQVVKLYGLIATLLGTFAGGWLMQHIGVFRTLLICGFAHMLTNLLLVFQARIGADVQFLTYTISLENFTGGMSTAAFIAYLGALCRRNYTATQYALLSSLAAFGRTWLSTPSGALSQAVGWEMFFAIASVMAIPALLLLVWLERQKPREIT